MLYIDKVTGAIVDAAYPIHTQPRPGLVGSVREAILAKALQERGLGGGRQAPLRFNGLEFDEGFRLDVLWRHA